MAALASVSAGLALAGPVAGAADAGPVAGASRTAAAGDGASLHAAPVRHIIEIMLENHTFDNLFPSLSGTPASPVHPVTAPPNEGDVQGGIDNSRVAERMAMDYQPGQGYLMDRYTDPPFGISAITTFGPQFDPNLQYLASTYEVADHNFQPVIGPTQPNVMMALNGTAHGWYYNTPDPHPKPWYSIFDELTAHDRSWKIYYALPPSMLRGTIWDTIIPPGHTADLTTADQFFRDLASGHLPGFSFVRPGVGYSEEPREDIGEGDAWLGQLVQAVAHSRYWKSSAIFVTYDEGGGFWDHVAPAFPDGYGTRTPMVIISPWAHLGVFGEAATTISILSFMQHLWRLPALTSLNARQNDLAGAFDFHQAPLPPPAVPVAPPDTIGFHGASDYTDVRAPFAGQWLRIRLEAETGGLTLDPTASGPVQLSVTPPAGVTVPPDFPSSVSLVRGRASVRVRFPAPGYYRIRADGPGASIGWTTIVVL
jgi:phospholipase C